MKKLLSTLLRSGSLKPGSPTFADVQAAQTRVSKALLPAPLTYSPTLSALLERDIFLKWENKFKTGSFKERGVVNTLALLSDSERTRGVCAASAGNHALALSYHSKLSKTPCTIVMPRHAPLVKVSATQSNGAEVILFGEAFDESYTHAQTLARQRGLTFIPAFDDPRVIAGQGTAGLEIVEQLADFDAVIVPVGGGGLISGIALAVKTLRPECAIIGVQSEWAIHHREPSYVKPTLVLADTSIADGIAVKKPGSYTQPLIDRSVDHLIQVSENYIAQAIIKFLETERVVVEGAGAVGLAALLAGTVPDRFKKVVVVISGSNIDVNLLSRLIDWDMGERQRLVKVNISVPDRPGSLSVVSGLIAQLGANVLEVFHDRSFSQVPGNVDITFRLEVRDENHKNEILENLRSQGLTVQEIIAQ